MNARHLFDARIFSQTSKRIVGFRQSSSKLVAIVTCGAFLGFGAGCKNNAPASGSALREGPGTTELAQLVDEVEAEIQAGIAALAAAESVSLADAAPSFALDDAPIALLRAALAEMEKRSGSYDKEGDTAKALLSRRLEQSLAKAIKLSDNPNMTQIDDFNDELVQIAELYAALAKGKGQARAAKRLEMRSGVYKFDNEVGSCNLRMDLTYENNRLVRYTISSTAKHHPKPHALCDQLGTRHYYKCDAAEKCSKIGSEGSAQYEAIDENTWSYADQVYKYVGE